MITDCIENNSNKNTLCELLLIYIRITGMFKEHTGSKDMLGSSRVEKLRQ